MKIAVYPGSFNPVPCDHMDIITRASKLFDKVIVLVSTNALKKTCFTAEERVNFLKRVTTKFKNVEIDSWDGLLIDYFKKVKADVIVKGLRAMSDFEYEFQMALVNKALCYEAETVFLAANVVGTFLSSSMVKQVAMFDGDISSYVPCEIENDIKIGVKKLLNKENER